MASAHAKLVPTRYTDFAAGNVMFVLPPQSPAPVGDAGEAAPASAKSSKSQCGAESVATVAVRADPGILLLKPPRLVSLVPVMDSVPFTVMFP